MRYKFLYDDDDDDDDDDAYRAGIILETSGVARRRQGTWRRLLASVINFVMTVCD